MYTFLCQLFPECVKPCDLGLSYSGNLSTTPSGRTCQVFVFVFEYEFVFAFEFVLVFVFEFVLAHLPGLGRGLAALAQLSRCAGELLQVPLPYICRI